MKIFVAILMLLTFTSVNAQERKKVKSFEKKSTHKVVSKQERLLNYQVKLDSLKKTKTNPKLQAKLEDKIRELKTTK